MYELHEQVAELFEEAQELGGAFVKLQKPVRLWDAREPATRASKLRVKNEWRRRIDRELRALRAARRAALPPPPARTRPKIQLPPLPPPHAGSTVTRRCVTCGQLEELRPGLTHWQHMTKYGACLPVTSEKALALQEPASIQAAE